jgi:dihydroanticapsin dehydrogenase
VSDLAQRAVAVTGGGSGIGAASCEQLAASGAAIAVLDVDVVAAEQLCTKLLSAGAREAVPFEVDVREEGEVEAALATAAERFGGLHGLVTSAGVFYAEDATPLAEATSETFRAVLEINLVGTFHAIRHALPLLQASTAAGGPAGSIVTVASTAGLRGHGFGAGYTASKGGVISLTRLLAKQCAAEGIRANCVCPGLTDTPMQRGALENPEFEAKLAKSIPMGRAAQPGEIASLIVHLLSGAASYVSGQIIAADGAATVV